MRAVGSNYDYVIIGGGSAGCVLAGRLSEDPDCSVLLLEAGPRDRGLMMQIPAGVYRVFHDRTINWNYESEPQAELNGRRIPVPRGKVLGGSSSINALVYLRGHPSDYDAWAKAGMKDWSFAHCLSYFRTSETSDRGASLYHGDAGPLHVSSGRLKSPIFDAFLSDVAAAGYAVYDDLNEPYAYGFGRMDATTVNGSRCSASVAYLRSARRRPNLTVVTGALVERILIDKARAHGVRYRAGGKTIQVSADREVLLSAGAINSPQILMLSGVGPVDELTRHGIPVLADSPEVGRNLKDHLSMGFSFRCAQPVSLSWIGTPLGKAVVGSRWLARKDGPAASNIWEIGGFAKARPDDELAAVHYHLGPMMIVKNGRKFGLENGFMLHMAQLRQKSKGSLTLRSASPEAPPVIDFNFLSEPSDLVEMRESFKVSRELVGGKRIAAFGVSEVLPGPAIRTDAEIDAFLRQNMATEFHPSCTCRMGIDERSVVDAELKVRGIDGLRVVDASIMPDIVGANLNATVIMIAEKAADMIRGRAPLAPAELGSGTVLKRQPERAMP